MKNRIRRIHDFRCCIYLEIHKRCWADAPRGEKMKKKESVPIIKIDTNIRYSEDEIKKKLQEIVDYQNEIANTFKSFNSSILDSIQNALNFNLSISENVIKILSQSLTEYFESIGKNVESIINTISLDDIVLRTKDLPNALQESLILLSEHNWYFDSEIDLSILWVIREKLINQKVEEVNKYFIDFYKKNMSRIETNLSNCYPNRKILIEKALKAHRKKDYELSIPVLLIQIDGICKEKTGFYLFLRENKIPEIANYVLKDNSGDIRKASMYPLSTITPIMKNIKERKEGFSELNRHLVLHGDSLDYASELNSYKTISLLNYVSQILK